MKILVYHTSYGFDTGCCGHVIEVDGKENFQFSHPNGEDPKTWAENLIREEYGEEHVKDLDWENCEVSDD